MTDYERYVQLGWEILEHKWRYYIGVRYNVKPIPDEEYDKIEAEYINLAHQLGQEEYSNNAVGFPIDRASGKLVDQKMRKQYNIQD